MVFGDNVHFRSDVYFGSDVCLGDFAPSFDGTCGQPRDGRATLATAQARVHGSGIILDNANRSRNVTSA